MARSNMIRSTSLSKGEENQKNVLENIFKTLPQRFEFLLLAVQTSVQSSAMYFLLPSHLIFISHLLNLVIIVEYGDSVREYIEKISRRKCAREGYMYFA